MYILQLMTLVTGAAGFIGYHVARRLLERGDQVTGLDNFNDYYDPALKQARHAALMNFEGFTGHRVDLADAAALQAVFEQAEPDLVIHMAAQAGVRYSQENPRVYLESNVMGFGNILECCRHRNVGHLVYASSSSVYGANRKMPYSVHDNVDHPLSLYAATKKACELMAHTYSHIFRLPTTGLRFFTVYGPWGRPDMAYFKFADKIMAGEPIDVYNNGEMWRDFTYIDDIVNSILALAIEPPKPNPDWNAMEPNPGTSSAPYRVFNIGAHSPVKLLAMIVILERLLGRRAEMRMLPMPAGDVLRTFADVSDLEAIVGFSPSLGLEEGLSRFASWHQEWANR